MSVDYDKAIETIKYILDRSQNTFKFKELERINNGLRFSLKALEQMKAIDAAGNEWPEPEEITCEEDCQCAECGQIFYGNMVLAKVTPIYQKAAAENAELKTERDEIAGVAAYALEYAKSQLDVKDILLSQLKKEHVELKARLDGIVDRIKDDAHAITFQSMAQYRKSLLNDNTEVGK